MRSIIVDTDREGVPLCRDGTIGRVRDKEEREGQRREGGTKERGRDKGESEIRRTQSTANHKLKSTNKIKYTNKTK